MAEAAPAPAEGGGEEGGIPNTAKLALLGLVAAVQAVPGYAILASDEWQPPDGGMFRMTAVVTGAALFALVFMARRRLLRLRTRMVVTACAAAFVLALALLYAYHAVLQDRVVPFIYARQSYHALVPFGASHWARGEILEAIQATNGGAPRTAAGVTRAHLQNALSEAGPGAVLDPIPGSWRELTLGTLWLMYAAAMGLIVVGFGIAAVRLGTGIAHKRRAARAGAATADGRATAADAPAAESEAEGAPPPAAVASATADADADVALGPFHASAAAPEANGGGPGEPVMLRVELRAPAWALVGAAATLAWAVLRLTTRHDAPRRPSGPRRPGRDPRRGG